jgi:amino acid transporter
MSQLKKELGLGGVFCIATGAMISSGLFVLPGIAHAQAGPAVVFSYFFGGLLACCGMLSIAEVITAMPKAGGDYFVVTRTMGPAVGTVTGLLVWFSLTLKTSFALVGLSVFVRMVVEADPWLLGSFLCLFFLMLNLFGVKKAAWLQYMLVLFLLVVLGAYCAFGAPQVERDFLFPFVPYGWDAVFSTSGMVFVSYAGLLKSAAVAEEVRNPGRNIPLGMSLALIVVVLLYTVSVFVTAGVLPAATLDNSMTPLSDGGEALFGYYGRLALSAAAVFAFVTTANAGLLSASRYLLALSRDNLAPSSLGRVNQRFGSPHVALIVTALVVIGSLLLELKVLAGAASTVLILTFIMANLCVIILRQSGLFHYRPAFRSPLYPVVQLVGIVGPAFLLAEMGSRALLLALFLISIGLFFYWVVGRIRATREYALKVLIEKISDKERLGGELDRELKRIVREREELEVDRFDELIEEAVFLDLDEEVNVAEVTERIVDALVEKWGIDPIEVSARVRSHLTADALDKLTPEVAVGDLEIGCDRVFDLIIIRDRQVLRGAGTSFRALFLIVSCRGEERRFIQSVAALSQILMHSEIENEFFAAKNERRIKDLLQLGKRRRDMFNSTES